MMSRKIYVSQMGDAEVMRMTDKEAREIIIEERDSLKANPMVKVEDCLYEAFDLAIKALEQTRWIPVSERLPEIKQHVLLSCYGRVIYGRMISEDENSGYPVFEICDNVGEKRPIVLETTVHSEYTTNRIKAWMPLPQPYAESEGEE